MGYPPFNLTTLQLVAPSSNMTKAEYKDAYGIDLDEVNIKAFKLVLFGGEKYAIDQIKEVEDGIEIYFNGRIMSITDIVQVSDEVYDVANSKPIYCHPIQMFIQNKCIMGCLILNNSSEPIDTWAKLKSAIHNFGGDSYNRLILSGGYFEEQAIICSHIIEQVSTQKFILMGVGVDGTVYTTNNGVDLTNVVFTEIIDNLNKIN